LFLPERIAREAQARALVAEQRAATAEAHLEELKEKGLLDQLAADGDLPTENRDPKVEYAEGHIKNAVNVNWNGDAFETEIQTMDKTKPVFVYCLSGGRSSSAVSKMNELGFKEIYELDGGMRAWYNANKSVESGTTEAKGMSMDEFNTQLKTDKLVLVDFNAEWCVPCKKMAPVLHEIANEMSDKLILLEIDVDKHVDVSNELKIESLPTLMLYKNGSVVWSTLGLTEKQEVLEAIKNN
jgi:thioredoxin